MIIVIFTCKLIVLQSKPSNIRDDSVDRRNLTPNSLPTNLIVNLTNNVQNLFTNKEN